MSYRVAASTEAWAGILELAEEQQWSAEECKHEAWLAMIDGEISEADYNRIVICTETWT